MRRKSRITIVTTGAGACRMIGVWMAEGLSCGLAVSRTIAGRCRVEVVYGRNAHEDACALIVATTGEPLKVESVWDGR